MSSSISIQYNEVVRIWQTTKDTHKVERFIEMLDKDSQQELLAYIQVNVDFIAAMAEYLAGQE